MNALVVVHSYHHGNTARVAAAIAQVLGAEVRTPAQVAAAELGAFDLVGFGSGIDSGHHYTPLLDLAGRLPTVNGKAAFIFSTYGAPAGFMQGEAERKASAANHAALQRELRSKGYAILGEFSCPGHNTNHFLKWFGGLNKGRPDSRDLRAAAEFAHGLLNQAGRGQTPSGGASV